MRRLLALFLVLALVGVASARNMEPGSLYYNFSLYTLDALGASPSNCTNEVASSEAIESICGDYTGLAKVFVDDFEAIITSDIIDDNYDIEPLSDWFCLEDDDGSIDFYGRTYRFGDVTFLASYQNPDTQGENAQVFFGVGEAVSAFVNQADGPYTAGLSISNREAFVTASDYGDEWPLTIGSGFVQCIPPNRVVFVDVLGRRYPLNGTARSTISPLTPLEDIWAMNPELPGARILITPLLQLGLELCN